MGKQNKNKNFQKSGFIMQTKVRRVTSSNGSSFGLD